MYSIVEKVVFMDISIEILSCYSFFCPIWEMINMVNASLLTK